MELRHLRYFVTVAEHLNFRKAAEVLHISRPALSKQVKDLENDIRVKLLDRDTVSVSLTPAGEVFLREAKQLLFQAQQAIERATETQHGTSGKLRIASVGLLASHFLPNAIRRFHLENPAVETRFVEMLPSEQQDALAEGKIDIGFAYGSHVVLRPGMEQLCVIRSEMGIALPHHHPLAERSGIYLHEIQEETLLCIGHATRSDHRTNVQEFCNKEEVQFSRIRNVEGFDSLVTLVAARQGISLLPRLIDLRHQGVVILPIQGAQEEFEFLMWAVWMNLPSSRWVKAFVEILKHESHPRMAELIG